MEEAVVVYSSSAQTTSLPSAYMDLSHSLTAGRTGRIIVVSWYKQDAGYRNPVKQATCTQLPRVIDNFHKALTALI